MASRASSGAAKPVDHTLLPINSFGVATARTASSIPRSRNTSRVRWLVMCARGECAVPAYLVTVIASTPSRASNAAAVRPAGPAPTTRTSVSMVA